MRNAQPSDRIPFYVAGAFALALGILHPLDTVYRGPLYSLDNKWTDQMFRWRGMEPADPRISIVAIDDESIRNIGQYPWPRSVYSKLLDRLFADGVKAAGLDILFLDPSRPEEDQALVRATRKWGKRVIHSINMTQEGSRYGFQMPFPALAAAVKSKGVVNQLELDPDGLIRKTDLMVGTNPSRRPDRRDWTLDPAREASLGLEALSVYAGRPADDYVRDRNVIYLNLRGQDKRAVLVNDAQGQAFSAFEPIYGIARIPAIHVLQDKLSPSQRMALDGGIVLVGSTALAAFDHYPTPFVDQAPAVEVHATVIDNLLNHRELHRVRGWVTLLLVLGLAFFAAWTLSLSPLAGTLLAGGMLAAWIAANIYAFHRYWVLQFTAPALALAGPFLILLVRRTLKEHQEKRFIKQTFGQFVAPEVVEDLTKDPDRVKKMLQGEKREMSVLFLDIAHFTAISEKMDPQALIQFLNRYLSELSEVVHKHQGVVDKYIGDCIMAFWNAPLEQQHHRKLACLAAVECQEVVQELNRRLDGAEKPAIRIGVNAGLMTVGLTGSQQKLQYTVIGDEVNLASRLEGANKFFGSRILISEFCYAGAKDAVEARELGRIRVVGKSVPIRVYELLGRKGSLADAWKRALPLYQEGLRAFSARDFVRANAKFAEALKILPEDGASKLYLKTCAGYIAVPPPDSWDGVFTLDAK